MTTLSNGTRRLGQSMSFLIAALLVISCGKGTRFMPAIHRQEIDGAL